MLQTRKLKLDYKLNNKFWLLVNKAHNSMPLIKH